MNILRYFIQLFHTCLWLVTNMLVLYSFLIAIDSVVTVSAICHMHSL